MNADHFKGKWNQFKGELKKQWGKITDDDLTRVEGDYDKFKGLMQEREPNRTLSLQSCRLQRENFLRSQVLRIITFPKNEAYFQAEDEEHAEALLTLLINTSRFPAASDGAAPPALRSPHRGYKLC